MWSPFASSTPENPGQRPWLLEVRSSKALIVSAVSIAVFTDLFLYGVIVPVVPFALETRAGIHADQTQYWVSVLIAVYGAFLLVASPIFGWVADKTTTRRAPLLVGLFLLAGATGFLAAGTSITLWIIGRALQGLSAAVVWVTGLALLVDTVGQHDVAQYLGYVGLSMSLALLISPLLGGVVFDKGGYYAVFGMCFALIALDVFLRLVMIEKRVASRWLPANVNSKPSSTISSVLGPSSSVIIPDGAAQISPSSITLQPKKLSKLPPIVTLVKSRRLLAALWGAFVQAALFTSLDSTLPIRVRNIFHWDSLGAGLIFLPVAIPAFLSPIIGILSDKYGPRWFATVGFLLAVPPMVLLRLVDYDSIGQKVLFCALLAIFGFAIDLTFPPIMAEITYVVAAKERAQPGMFGAKGAYAQAYGLFNMAFAAGCLVGPLWGGLVQDAAGWPTMTWTLALLSGVTVIPTVLMVGGWIGGSKEAERKEQREGNIAEGKAARAGKEAAQGNADKV